MVAKLIAVILAVGAAGIMMLDLRQQRLQTMHDIAMVQRRMAEHDRELFRVRTRIAAAVVPQQVEQLAARLGPTTPINVPLPGDADGPRYASTTPPYRPGSTSTVSGSGHGRIVPVGLPGKPAKKPSASPPPPASTGPKDGSKPAHE